MFGALFLLQAFVYFRLRFNEKQRENQIFVTNSQLYPDALGLEPTKKKEEKIQVTWMYYDEVKWYEQNKKMFLPIMIVFGVHLYTNASTPLILVALTQTLQFYQHQLFQIHVLGKSPKLVRALKRPWPNPPSQIPFGNNGFFGQKLKSLRSEMEKYDEEVNPPVSTSGKPKVLNRKKARKLNK